MDELTAQSELIYMELNNNLIVKVEGLSELQSLIAGTPTRGTFEVLEPCDGKLSRTVLRGLGAGNSPWLPGVLR